MIEMKLKLISKYIILTSVINFTSYITKAGDNFAEGISTRALFLRNCQIKNENGIS